MKEGAVPTIVPTEIFDQAQSRFMPYSSKCWRRPNNVKYLMSGGFRCINCGNSMFGSRFNKILKQTGERAFYEYYRCSGDARKGLHRDSYRPMIRREAVDSVAIDGILKRAESLMDFSRVMTLFQNKLRAFLDERPNRLEHVEKEIRKVEREIERTIEIYVKFEHPVPEERIKELKARKVALEAQRDGLIAAGENRMPLLDIEREANEFVSRARSAKSILYSGLPQDRIRVREMFLKGVEIEWLSDRIEVKFHWRKLPGLCRLEELVCGSEKTAQLHAFLLFLHETIHYGPS